MGPELRLWIGTVVVVETEHQTVVGISGNVLRLADREGGIGVWSLPALCRAPGFRIDGQVRSGSLSGLGALADPTAGPGKWVRFLEAHVLECETGTAVDGALTPRPQYDPATKTLAERDAAKVAELLELGHPMSVRTWRRWRQRAKTPGDLVIRAKSGSNPVGGISARIDARVVEATFRVAAEIVREEDSTRTKKHAIARVQALLEDSYGMEAPALPSMATMYRLFDVVDRGRKLFGKATSRRSRAKSPPAPYHAPLATRPGEIIQVDSTPIDVLCRFADGYVGSAELTIAVDVATRSIVAGVFSPTTKAVDVTALLSRMVVPLPMRPNWDIDLALSRSTLPGERLIALDERLRLAAAAPVIVPETIVYDQGLAFTSEAVRRAARLLGTNLQGARPDTPTDKAIVERTFNSIKTLFSEHVRGYKGSNVTLRGRKLERLATYSVPQLQEMFDEWVVAVWQNRPNRGLADQWGCSSLTPNEAYAVCVARAGYVPVPLGSDDYVELLPMRWRSINEYGINFQRRTYMSEGLRPFTNTTSPIPNSAGKWEVHYDPYNIFSIWVRNPQGGWITVPWIHRRQFAHPFGSYLWDQASAAAAGAGPRPTELETVRTVQRIVDSVRATEPLTSALWKAVAVDANAPQRPGATALPQVLEDDEFASFPPDLDGPDFEFPVFNPT